MFAVKRIRNMRLHCLLRFVFFMELLGSAKHRTGRRLIIDDGPCHTFYEERVAFLTHFAQSLDGQIMSFDDLCRIDRSTPPILSSPLSTAALSESLLSPTVCANRFSSCPAHEAVGEDLIHSRLFRIFPSEMARLFYPLFVKATVLCRPPLQWKGGMLHDIFKRKGSPADLGNYRDVTMSNQTSKIYGCHLRSALSPLVERGLLTINEISR